MDPYTGPRNENERRDNRRKDRKGKADIRKETTTE